MFKKTVGPQQLTEQLQGYTHKLKAGLAREPAAQCAGRKNLEGGRPSGQLIGVGLQLACGNKALSMRPGYCSEGRERRDLEKSVLRFFFSS